jgi:hypothetical protein
MEGEILALRREVDLLLEKCSSATETSSHHAPEMPPASQILNQGPDARTNPRLENEQSQDGRDYHPGMQVELIDGQQQHWQIVMDPESRLGDLPGSCVSHVPSAPASGDSMSPYETIRSDDIALSRTITEEKLQHYYEIYMFRFDHFLYRILGDRHNLESMRASSPMLTAVICAIGALHTNSSDFTACYKHFMSLVEKKALSKGNSMDDVLALVLGAYWLYDMSWALAAAAVRLAVDCQLHKSIAKALEGNKTHYLRARLYYLVFICDHHYSIVYGRPPLVKQCETIRAAPAFSKSAHATPDDMRIRFQIEFWSFMEDIYDTFGINVDKPLDRAGLQHVSMFSIRLETIRTQWADGFESNPYIGNYASKGTVLYFHLAKLYLFTHALRGIIKPADEDETSVMKSSIERENAANAAIFAATATIRTVIVDSEIQSWLNGFHAYYHVMVAFATVFLLKICKHFQGSLYYDVDQIHNY